jgi:hypothetical protein
MSFEILYDKSNLYNIDYNNFIFEELRYDLKRRNYISAIKYNNKVFKIRTPIINLYDHINV